jgi:hypothetical protein
MSKVDAPSSRRWKDQIHRWLHNGLHHPVGRRKLPVLVATYASAVLISHYPDPRSLAAESEIILVQKLEGDRGFGGYPDVEGAVGLHRSDPEDSSRGTFQYPNMLDGPGGRYRTGAIGAQVGPITIQAVKHAAGGSGSQPV